MKIRYLITLFIATIVIFFSIKYKFISTLESIGIFLTGIATLLTLWEVKTQRESSFKPDIYLKDKKIDFRLEGDRVIWKSETTDMELVNIGLGPAKNIEVIWDMNITQKLADKINNLKDEKFDIYLQEFTTTINKSIYVDESVSNCKYDYLLPVNINVNPKLIKVPESMIQLYSLYIILCNGNVKNFEFTIKIIYFDSAGKKCEKKFVTELYCIALNKETNEGQFQIKTKQ